MCPGIPYTTYTFKFDGLCTFNKLVVQKQELVL